MSTRSLIADLHDGTDRWKINVRIFRKWNVYQKFAPTELFCVSMILLDAQGDKIQASAIHKSLHTRFLKDIKEGETYFLANFMVSPNSGQYKPTSNPFKVTITTFTHIAEESHDIPLHNYSFSSIPNIIKCQPQNDGDKLIDVLAFVRSMGTLEERGRDEGVKTILRMMLTDADKNDIECVLFDQCAIDAYHAQFNNSESPVIILLNLAKIGVGSSFNATRVLFNPQIKDVEEFINSAKQQTSPVFESCSQVVPTQLSQASSVSSLHKQSKIKISEIPDQRAGESFVIICELVKLETRHGWHYQGCTKCGTKPKAETKENGQVHDKCTGCNANPHTVESKLKLCYNVKDESRSVCIVFWDKLVVQLVDKTYLELKLSLDKEDAAYDFPAPLEDPIGKTVLVKLKLNDYNKRFPSANISVSQFTVCEDLLPEFIQAASEVTQIREDVTQTTTEGTLNHAKSVTVDDDGESIGDHDVP